jgi:hypothetical protein
MWARILVQIRVSKQIGILGTLLSKRDWEGVFKGQLTFALLCIPVQFAS